ncbi:hypothetical protein MKW98_019098 [Papaver atlanticum]|uniref:Uncharacterized protein n=1 Tax=Papaver atlanticum TaxID=357466 RepID=A0AAD4XZA6_9MAGN|nr:hypothetical protein MKW98_019098 [Papaver atlanticum]
MWGSKELNLVLYENPCTYPGMEIRDRMWGSKELNLVLYENPCTYPGMEIRDTHSHNNLSSQIFYMLHLISSQQRHGKS